MPIRTKIESFEHDIDLIVRNDLSPEAQSKAVANFAAAEIAKADDTNRRILGRLPPKTVTVDGKAGAPLNSVNPDGGTIIAEWELIGDVLEWIAQTLYDRSPVVSGLYRKSHLLFADGVLIETGKDIPQASEYVFINSQPYARKIEIGKTESGRDFVIQVENRIYERTAKDAKSRFGNLAKVTFEYQSAQGGAIGAWANSASARRLAASHGRRTHQIEWLTRQPAIVVTLSGQ